MLLRCEKAYRILYITDRYHLSFFCLILIFEQLSTALKKTRNFQPSLAKASSLKLAEVDINAILWPNCQHCRIIFWQNGWVYLISWARLCCSRRKPGRQPSRTQSRSFPALNQYRNFEGISGFWFPFCRLLIRHGWPNIYTKNKECFSKL